MFRRFHSRVNLTKLLCTLAEEIPEIKHIFRRQVVWEDEQSFVTELVKNVIYNKDGLVAINKPYGVGQSEPLKLNESAHRNQKYFGDQFYLNNVLPQLSAAFGYTSLEVIKTPERYSTGVTLLAANEDIKTKIRTTFAKDKRQNNLPASYLVLSIGRPTRAEDEKKVAIKLDESENKKRYLPIIVTSWSKNENKLRKVKTVYVYHRVVTHSDLVSLVEVKPSRTKSHFLRLYMSTQLLSPILGDHLCGSRVQHVMGVHLLIDHWSSPAVQQQKIPKEILSQLDLNKKDSSLVPSHIHLNSLTIANYLGKRKHLQLHAPLPESFIWTCNQLGIQLEKKYLTHR